MMLARPDWRGYAVLDGDAEIVGPHNSEANHLRLKLRDVYRVSMGQEHGDWDDYDRAMVEQERVAVLLRPARLYGQNLT